MSNEINVTLESLQAAADELNKKIAALQSAKEVIDEVNEVEDDEFTFEDIDNSCHKAKSGSGK